MRSSGILRSWNEDRGFGFIAPAQGGAEVFVHISAFPRDGSRPTVGETVSYELGQGRDGRPQAIDVVRGAVGVKARAPRPPAPPARSRGAPGVGTWLARVVVLLLLIAAGRWGYSAYEAHARRAQLASQPPAAAAAPDETPSSAAYRCDGRTRCSQMTSCEEATWFVNHCPGTQMDGNGDGVPCEQQWCTAPARR